MESPIRILQVCGRMNYGGAETMIMTLYRNIDRTKIQFDFIVHTQEQCAFDSEILSLGGNIYHCPQFIGRNIFKYIKWWEEFFYNHKEYKIIHSHVRSTASIFLGIAKKYGLKTIVHSHSTSSGSGISSLVKNLMQKSLRKKVDYLFACSKKAGVWLYGEKACDNSNYYLLKNAIDVEKFTFDQQTRKRIRNTFNIDSKFVIGHVGRFSEPKNHSFLIDAFSVIRQKIDNAVLLLVGDGELIDEVRKKVKLLNLNENVIFTGSRSDVYDLYQAMDCFLFPSLWEGLPMAVIEAQTAGLRCFISNKVTTEVKLTDLVTFITINQGVEPWVNEVLEIYHKQGDLSTRYDNFYLRKMIGEAGYDISKTTLWLTDFYINLYKTFR